MLKYLETNKKKKERKAFKLNERDICICNIHLSICLSIYLSIYSSICLSLSIYI